MADLVHDARASRAHLVGLPERCDLGRDLVLEPSPREGPERGIVQRLEDPAELQLRLQHGATRRLGGVRGDHELERHLARAAGLLLRLDATRGEPPERLGQRFPRDRCSRS